MVLTWKDFLKFGFFLCYDKKKSKFLKVLQITLNFYTTLKRVQYIQKLSKNVDRFTTFKLRINL